MSNTTRRTVVAGLGAAAVVGATGIGGAATSSTRMPAVYVPHGGGPWPWLGEDPGYAALTAYLRGLPGSLPASPRAILVVTAHWEAPQVTLTSSASPPLYFDYSGFPEHTYRIQWPAPGAADLVPRVQELLAAAGIPSGTDGRRGYDHGTFVPLAVAWPEADVPVLQMSLVRGLDPKDHLAIGRALAPLRDEGVLLVGSGMSYHDMRGFFSVMRGDGAAAKQVAQTFADWLVDSASDLDERLAHWAEAPAARRAHPREEHLLPLMVVAGAGGEDPVSVPFDDDVLGVRVNAIQVG